MPLLFVVITPVGDLGQPNINYLMKGQKSKCNYESPTVEVIAARVEAGYQTSGIQDESNPNTTRYNADSWDTPSPNNGTPQYT